MGFCENAEQRGFSDLRQSNNSCLHKPQILAHTARSHLSRRSW
jgi:hypothetical protein